MRRVIVLLMVWSATAVSAQNLVVNGDFDSNTSSWDFTTAGTFTHSSSLDADDTAPASGSGQLANTATLAYGTSFAGQCITTGIAGGSAYDWGAKIRFDSGNTQTATGTANVVVNFLDGAGCSGSVVGGSATTNVSSSAADVWTQTEVLGWTAPAGAVSAYLSLWTTKVESSGTITVNFDNVVFGPAGTLPVELVAFVVE